VGGAAVGEGLRGCDGGPKRRSVRGERHGVGHGKSVVRLDDCTAAAPPAESAKARGGWQAEGSVGLTGLIWVCACEGENGFLFRQACLTHS
jgi:hypothetical protein